MLEQALKQKGISKSDLAKLMEVNRKTITRMGDELTPEVKEMLSDLPDKKDFTMDEIEVLCKRRGGIEGVETGKETDYDLAHSVGLKVWEFNWLISQYAGYKNGRPPETHIQPSCRVIGAVAGR